MAANDKRIGPLPEPTNDDSGYAIAKVAVQSVPIVGHAAVVFMELLFSAPLERRREKWLIELGKAVNGLLQGRSAESLLADEPFLTAVMIATSIAMRTHQSEKLMALRNAVENSATPSAFADDKRAIFLRFVDDLTPTHIRALSVAGIRKELRDDYGRRIYLDNPTPFVTNDPRDVSQFIRVIVLELQSRGLLWMKEDAHYPNNPNSLGSIPPLALEFLRFIGLRRYGDIQ